MGETECSVWMCDLLDQIAIYICTNDELDRVLTVCPSVADNATKRVRGGIQIRAGHCPWFRCGRRGVDLYSDEAGRPLRFARNLKNRQDIHAMAATVAQSASVHLSVEACVSAAIYRWVLNGVLPVVLGSFPYCAMIACALFSKELFASCSQILFLVGTPLATAFLLWHPSQHNGARCLIRLFPHLND